MVCYLYQQVENSQNTFDFLDCKLAEVHKRQRFATPDLVDERTLRRDLARRDAGYPMDPTSLPRKVLWRTRRPEPLEVLPGFIVNDRFRQLVERFEPGLHQFISVELYRHKNEPPVAEYYWFIVCQRAATIDPEQTTCLWDEGSQYWMNSVLDRTTMTFHQIKDAKLVYSARLAANRHIWVDPTVPTHADRLCSEEFAQAARDANFRGLGVVERETC